MVEIERKSSSKATESICVARAIHNQPPIAYSHRIVGEGREDSCCAQSYTEAL